MVQEVQTQWNRYQTPNRIEWIWVSERKVSDHTQVRNKKTNMATFTTTIGIKDEYWEKFASSWTYDATDWIKYKVIWWDIYMSQSWAYMVEYTPYQWYVSTYNVTLKMYVDNTVVYELTTTLADRLKKTFVVNLWFKNKIRVSMKSTSSASASPQLEFKFIKL